MNKKKSKSCNIVSTRYNCNVKSLYYSMFGAPQNGQNNRFNNIALTHPPKPTKIISTVLLIGT